MSELLLLAGKVRKRSLPVIKDLSSPGGPPPRRLALPQGELAHLYDAEEGIRYLAFVELRPGTLRGNHFHKIKEESLYIVRGQLRLLVADPASNARAELLLHAGDLAVIQTGVAHALHTLEPGQAVEFAPARFDPADAYPFALA